MDFGILIKKQVRSLIFKNSMISFLFMNRSAHLVFYVNEDNEVESYEQTMLETIEPII